MSDQRVHRWPEFRAPRELHLYRDTSKRALWVALKHAMAARTGEYDAALEDGRWFKELRRELANTRGCP